MGNHQQGIQQYQVTGGHRDWRAGWTDFRHPKIKALMDRYLDKNNGLMRAASDNRISQRYHVSAGQTAAHICAGAAHWAGACSPSVDFNRTEDTPVPMISQTSSQKPL